MTYRPYEIHGEDRKSRWLITCDHASNLVPDSLGGTLGLPAEDMERHIAYDIGAAGTSRALADALGCPAVLSRFSRLVIDPNRGNQDPTQLMRIYDGSVIPGNRAVDAAEHDRRRAAYFSPYHDAVSRLADRHSDTVIVAMHSFTRQLRARAPRPWHVGVLFGWDSRLADPFIRLLNADPDLVVGANQPYAGYLPGDGIDRHALSHGRMNVLIELRQDLIETPGNQQAWGERLAPVLEAALAETISGSKT
ncbi:MAG: N-formylglutamate amidohydrolase [Rhodobacteraceae bacterium]|nr:N-formylglutamate amidohydrolase [Paracoccaceae bacterium]